MNPQVLADAFSTIMNLNERDYRQMVGNYFILLEELAPVDKKFSILNDTINILFISINKTTNNNVRRLNGGGTRRPFKPTPISTNNIGPHFFLEKRIKQVTRNRKKPVEGASVEGASVEGASVEGEAYVKASLEASAKDASVEDKTIALANMTDSDDSEDYLESASRKLKQLTKRLSPEQKRVVDERLAETNQILNTLEQLQDSETINAKARLLEAQNNQSLVRLIETRSQQSTRDPYVILGISSGTGILASCALFRAAKRIAEDPANNAKFIASNFDSLIEYFISLVKIQKGKVIFFQNIVSNVVNTLTETAGLASILIGILVFLGMAILLRGFKGSFGFASLELPGIFPSQTNQFITNDFQVSRRSSRRSSPESSSQTKKKFKRIK